MRVKSANDAASDCHSRWRNLISGMDAEFEALPDPFVAPKNATPGALIELARRSAPPNPHASIGAIRKNAMLRTKTAMEPIEQAEAYLVQLSKAVRCLRLDKAPSDIDDDELRAAVEIIRSGAKAALCDPLAIASVLDDCGKAAEGKLFQARIECRKYQSTLQIVLLKGTRAHLAKFPLYEDLLGTLDQRIDAAVRTHRAKYPTRTGVVRKLGSRSRVPLEVS